MYSLLLDGGDQLMMWDLEYELIIYNHVFLFSLWQFKYNVYIVFLITLQMNSPDINHDCCLLFEQLCLLYVFYVSFV